MPGRQSRAGHPEQLAHLSVDYDGVQALFAAEVLVDDRLGDLGASRELLDRRALEAALGEECPGDLDQLLTPLGAEGDLGKRAEVVRSRPPGPWPDEAAGGGTGAGR